MKVITDYKELVGKTIAFAHFAQFADQVTIGTTDQEVFMAHQVQGDDGDLEIQPLYPRAIKDVLNKHSFLRQELATLGIFDMDEYQRIIARERKEQEEKSASVIRERELAELARLKKKYETPEIKFAEDVANGEV